jgi:excisionase family DNA binding protein
LTVASDPLLTIEEAAERLRISRAAAYKLVRAGKIEMVTVYGNRRRVLTSSVDSYVERQRSDQD